MLYLRAISLKFFIAIGMASLLPLSVPAQVDNGKTLFELMERSFEGLYTESTLIHKEILSGCGKGHLRGRFLWVRHKELPGQPTEGRYSASEGGRGLTTPIRYGEFYYRENNGEPYLAFHGLDFSSYTRQVKYEDLCPKNKDNPGVYCNLKELDFKNQKAFEKPPLVICQKI